MDTDQKTTILLYGRLADVLGPSVDIPAAPGCTVADLRNEVARRFPTAAEALHKRRVRACIGNSIVPDSHCVQPGEQVEFLPPVSGG